MGNKYHLEPYYILYETGNTGCFLCYENTLDDAKIAFNTYVEILKNWTSNRKERVDLNFEPYEFWIPQISIWEDFYDIKSHKNTILNCELSLSEPNYSLYVVKIDQVTDPSKLERIETNFFYDKNQTLKRPIQIIIN